MPDTISTPLQTGETVKTGYTFVANGMQPYNVGETNAETIYELTENMYITGPISQLVNLILPKEATISVYDEEDNTVEDVSRKLNRMFAQPACNINTMIRAVISDLFLWGISIYNPVWQFDGNELVCTECTRLHPFTFSQTPQGKGQNQKYVYGRILHGIYYDTTDNRVHYWQKQGNNTVELPADCLYVVKDPSAQNPDGNSLILPTAPVVEFLAFAWNALGQQMFRTAAPVMFIKISNPLPDRTENGQFIEGDISYAQRILESWGKDTGFNVRDNMEIHTIDVKEGSLAKSAIELAAKAIGSYISPVGMLGENSSLIAGNSDASIRLINNNIQGWVNLIAQNIRDLPNYYLKHNGYPEGWHAEINIPSTTIEDNANKLARAQLLASTKTGTVNEIRELMGCEGISDDEMRELQSEWTIINPPSASPFSFTDKNTPAPSVYRTRNHLAHEATTSIDEEADELETKLVKAMNQYVKEQTQEP